MFDYMQELKQPVQKVPVDRHEHECPGCLERWQHTHDMKGNTQAHTCPNCGRSGCWARTTDGYYGAV